MAGCHTTCYASFVRMGKNKLSRTIFCLYLQLARRTPILRHNGYERVSLHGGNRDSVFFIIKLQKSEREHEQS